MTIIMYALNASISTELLKCQFNASDKIVHVCTKSKKKNVQ